VEEDDGGVPDKPKAATDLVTATQPVHPADIMMFHISPGQVPKAGISPRTATNTTPSPPTTKPTAPSPSPTNPTSPTSPGSTSPGGQKTAYCRHWIRHGTCKWGPYCRHAHAMPATLPGLAEVGLRDFPAWWTAALGQLAVASSPPGGGIIRGAGRGGAGRSKAAAVRMGFGGFGGYGYGFGGGMQPGFVPYGRGGYGAVGGLAVGGVGYVGRERVVREREVHPREMAGRKVKVQVGLNGGVMGAPEGVREKVGEGEVLLGQGGAAAQAPAVVQSTAVGRGRVVVEEKQCGFVEEQVHQEARVQQGIPQQAQQKLVDV